MGPVPIVTVGSPVEVPFSGRLDDALSGDVQIERRWAATVGSRATNNPPHAPPAGKTFDKPPTNKGKIFKGSATVLINNRAAARDSDVAETCNDPNDLPIGSIVAKSAVIVGG